MKNAEYLLDVIGELPDQNLTETTLFLQKRKSKRIFTVFGSVAAIFVFAVCVYFAVMAMTWDGNRDNSITGATGGGYFYFAYPRDGIYRYQPGGTAEKLVGTLFNPRMDYCVNDYALYYTNGKDTVYCIPHGKDKAYTLFAEEGADNIHIGYRPGRYDLEISYDFRESDLSEEIVIDGKTGEKIMTIDYLRITEKVPEDPRLSDEAFLDSVSDDELVDITLDTDEYTVDSMTYKVGDRTITAKKTGDNQYILTENGKNLFGKETMWYALPQKWLGECPIFTKNPEGLSEYETAVLHYYIIRPDGTQTKVTYESDELEPQGNEDYFYYIDWNSDCLTALNTRTLEKTVLMNDEDLAFCSMNSDGKYLYLYRYHNDSNVKHMEYPIRCYRIRYDGNGKPEGLELIDDDIVK